MIDGNSLAAAFANSILIAFAIAFVAGVGLTLAVIYGAPWVWHLIKPFIHQLTV